jgi:hypothetical protein
MIWDMDSIQYAVKIESLVVPVFGVLEQILALPSLACKESVLHGLGHLYWKHPEDVERIIDSFLARREDVPEELLSYARSARSGCIR